ncbi:exodeoxyribonuclease VII large subunit [Lactobacillus sp. Sy-1]|uniref:exodeoxyribonuclease VII large subunit n=1 Tax=Lactobacillus sp. Sy-1 TaxID=2109645 RepID=UPI001C59AA7C|nr:exodeoxyribonuclease VII large subunit [Lactobacillus sp. Sy-1]MBW1605642.1 exodeoxyribonuclease VII large subunit [Lactobacillus sp. Sy-1]
MTTNPEYLSVSAFTGYIKRKFDVDPYLEHVYITGEISNFRRRPKHQYFSLKDDKTKINVMMWKSDFDKVPFELEEGMKVNASGRISVYEVGGNYQLYIKRIEPDGIGALYQAFEQLKKRLASEGLFDPAHKQPIPNYPKRIAVVTSESGAVIKDIITTVRRRYPIAQIVLFPAVVQGDKAADDIVTQIERVNALGNYDTLIIGRGGGSIEDLWPFNEERVARAIYNSQIPIISSVGHETDTTIADYVADMRAATPTAAAEEAVPKLSQVLINLNQLHDRTLVAFRNLLFNYQQRLANVQASYVFKQPERLYEAYVQHLDNLNQRLNAAFKGLLNDEQNILQKLNYDLRAQSPMGLIQNQGNQLKWLDERLRSAIINQLNDKQNHFKRVVNALDHLSPLQIMGRGYSYVSKDDHVIKTASELRVDDQITLGFIDGNAKAQIKQIEVKERKNND